MLALDRLQRQPEEYVTELTEALEKSPDDLTALQTLAEAHFELGAAEQALPLIERAISLDPAGKKGAAKFLWAGQIYGGNRGLDYFVRGVNALRTELERASETAVSAANRATVANATAANAANDGARKKAEDLVEAAAKASELCDALSLELSQAYLGMIEIWMTDLCMEPEAEEQCERLITEAFVTCETDPEAWSVLGSIRISQLRLEPAKEALRKSWELFSRSIEQETIDHAAIPKLIRLAQSMVEMQMLETVLEVTGELHRLDDEVPDLYYLNAVCHASLAEEASTPEERSKHIVAARDAAALLNEVVPDADPEIVEAIKQVVESLPEPEIADPYADEDRAMPVE